MSRQWTNAALPFARLLLVAVALGTLGPRVVGLGAFGLGTLGEEKPNTPEQCPYCRGNPELMAKAQIVSHGGFAFGKLDTHGVDGLLATSDIRWIETPHFEIGFALGSHKVEVEEKTKIRAELTELAAALPEVVPTVKVLDPWLRAHLYALRCEKLWKRMLAILQVSESDFPATPWTEGTQIIGMGQYLGQFGKFELLILPTQSSHSMYLLNQFGLTIKNTQRWNLIQRDTLSVTMHAQQGDLRKDDALHGHVVFNLGINLLDGYRHYSYDTPIWIREGLGHFLEREINPRNNSFDSSEGGIAELTRKWKWEPEVKKLVLKSPPRLAEVLGIKEYAELTLDDHFATWSMVSYLIATNPDGFAKFNRLLHDNVDSNGLPTGVGLLDLHREAFKECFGMSYPEFDAAWTTWVLAGHGGDPRKEEKEGGTPPGVPVGGGGG